MMLHYTQPIHQGAGSSPNSPILLTPQQVLSPNGRLTPRPSTHIPTYLADRIDETSDEGEDDGEISTAETDTTSCGSLTSVD